MKIFETKLIKKEWVFSKGFYWFPVGVGDGEDLSDDYLHQLFEFPSTITTVWISFYTASSKNRHRVKVRRAEWIADKIPEILFNVKHVEIYKGKKYSKIVEWNFESGDRVLNKYIGKTIYVQVEYYE